jgi:competence ComEA-like helix-hairpin-helix protein
MSQAHEELRGLPVPLAVLDDSARRERLVALVRLRGDDQFVVLGLLAILGICVVVWLSGFESGKIHIAKTTEPPARALRYLVDLNHAPQRELLQLPGIGPTLAERIVAYREQGEPFQNVADLENIRGIGVKKRESATPYVYIGDEVPGRLCDVAF